MIGKSLGARIVLLVIAIILLILCWLSGESSDVMLLVASLVVLRILFLCFKIFAKSKSDTTND